MAVNPRIELVNRFFSGTGHTYDAIVILCTFGLDWQWKREILKKIPENSSRMMDQGCGTGILTLLMARGFPKSCIVGVELRDEYLKFARKKARAQGIQNVTFIQGRAEEVVPEGKFDCITSSYLAKYAELRTLIQNIHRMLQDGGAVILHDFAFPKSAWLARLWSFYFSLLQTIGARIFPRWRTVFQELPDLIQHTTWVEDAVELLTKNGFSAIRRQSLTGGTSVIVSARRGSSPL